jgi:hypothetical protein
MEDIECYDIRFPARSAPTVAIITEWQKLCVHESDAIPLHLGRPPRPGVLL